MSTAQSQVSTSSTRRVLASAAVGQFVEFYDFVVYAYTATVLATHFFPSEDRVASLLATFAVYAVGFVMRPLGGLIWGHIGDRVGRRAVLAVIILIMGASTAMIGALPTYEQIGIAAPILLVVARMIQGLSVGGEAIGSNILVAEHSPLQRRGGYVALGYACGVIPAVVVAILVLGLNNLMGPDDFTDWGWRLLYFLGAALSLVGLYIRKRINESPAFEVTRSADRIPRAPIRTVLEDNRRSLVLAFTMATLSGLGFYSLTGYFPAYLSESVNLTRNESLASNSIALCVTFVAMPLAGALSDRIGRRPIMIGGALSSAVLAIPAYVLVSSGSFWNATFGQCILAATLGAFFGGAGIVWLELFPTRVRYTGAALSLNAAYVVFGGTAPLFSSWLVERSGSLLAPAFYLAILASLVFVGALFLPETYRDPLIRAEDVDSHEDSSDTQQSRSPERAGDPYPHG
jgi:MFS transporter, MHS family, proline/betaine transporter